MILRFVIRLAHLTKNKVCAVYWTLSNLPPGSHSSLSSIHLALLCRSEDIRSYSYEKVLEPLLRDLVTLESHGIFTAQLGDLVKGTIQCVIADNLGAHGIARLTENLYICRFCLAQKSEIQQKEASSDAFTLRSKETHETHVSSAQGNVKPCYGIKRPCVLSARLSHFNVCTGYPQILHMTSLKA